MSDSRRPDQGPAGSHSSHGTAPAESVAERRIREAMEAGEFDDLSGAGRPIPGAGKPDDDLWWVRGWLRRNDLDVHRMGVTGSASYGRHTHGDQGLDPRDS